MIASTGLWLPHGTAEKPPPGWGVDEDNPLAVNTLCFPLNEGASGAAFDMFGRQGTFSGPLTWDIGESGPCLRFMPGAAARMSFPGAVFGTTCWFAVRFMHLGSSTSYQALLANAGGSIELTYRGSLGKIDLVYSALDHTCATTVTGNVWHTVVVSCDNGAASVYLDGKLDGSFTGWPGFTVVDIGDDGGGDSFKGLINFAYGTNGRALTADQAAVLSQEPFAAFRPQTQFEFSPPAPVFTPPTSGGITFGGSSAPTLLFSMPTGGGVSFGGSAAPSTTYSPATTGGVILGGSSAPTFAVTASTAGGVTLGGSSAASLAFTMSTSGGLALGGSAAPVLVKPKNLLGAIQGFWNGTPELAAIQAGVYFGRIPARATPPWVFVKTFNERLPGTSIEDEPADGLFQIMTTDLDYTTQLGEVIAKHVTSGPERTEPPRDNLQWYNPVKGRAEYERYNLRFDSTPQERPGLGPGGMPLYSYELAYRFICDRTGALP